MDTNYRAKARPNTEDPHCGSVWYFTEIPRELTIIIISYIGGDNIINLLDALKLKIKNRDWMMVYSLILPDEYQLIKNIINIDPLLQENRYTKNWKEFVIDDQNMTPEINILYHSIEIYELFPQFYFKIKELPRDLNNRKYFNISLIKIHNQISDHDIRDHAFIEYFRTGIFGQSQPIHIESDLSLEFIYIMLLDGFIMNLEVFNKFMLLVREYEINEEGAVNYNLIYNYKLIVQIYFKLPKEYKDRFNDESSFSMQLPD
jgi:hypothetical protein